MPSYIRCSTLISHLCCIPIAAYATDNTPVDPRAYYQSTVSIDGSATTVVSNEETIVRMDTKLLSSEEATKKFFEYVRDSCDRLDQTAKEIGVSSEEMSDIYVAAIETLKRDKTALKSQVQRACITFESARKTKDITMATDDAANLYNSIETERLNKFQESLLSLYSKNITSSSQDKIEKYKKRFQKEEVLTVKPLDHETEYYTNFFVDFCQTTRLLNASK